MSIERTGAAVGPPNMRVEVSNRPENVVLVREMLSGVGEALGLDPLDLNDIRTAVTEACNNVVLHAYDGEEGPLVVEVYLPPGSLEVIVRDRGVGMGGQPAEADGGDPASVGIGVPVIRALVHRVEFAAASGGGTEVWMDFAVPHRRELGALDAGRDWRAPGLPAEALASTASLAVAPAQLARSVLPRLLAVQAARADFSTDRISDALLVADALGAHFPATEQPGHVLVAVSVEPRELELRIGPLRAGRGELLLADAELQSLGAILETLADGQAVVRAGGGEELRMRLRDRRGAA